MIVARIAEPSEVKSLGVDRVARPGATEEVVVATAGEADAIEADCRLTFQDGAAWVGDLKVPFRDMWRPYVQALASAAVDRAREIGSASVRIDVYELGDSTRDSLTDLGFAPRTPDDRVWEIQP